MMDIKKQPVVIVFSILAALQVINGGLMLSDAFSEEVAGLISLVIGAITAGASFYVRAMVTPWADVVSKISGSGNVVAGPAALKAPPVTPPPPEAPAAT
jgi:hypothetical protein